MQIVEVENLNYSLGEIEILKNINFSINESEYVAIVGPNGGGKSTLINTILGLNRNFSGKISLFEKNLKEFEEWSKIGFVPQRAVEIDQRFPIRVDEVVRLGFKRGFWKKGIEDEVLKQLGISHLKKRLIGELSGGQKQRVMIARALISKPKLLVLDEPNTGVDSETQQNFHKILRKLNREYGITILFITHDIGMIEDSITSIMSINRELIASKEPHNIFNCKVMRDVYGIESHLREHRH